jgi:hypothetical protein
MKNEVIVIRHIKDFTNHSGSHILSGGLHDNASKTLTIIRRNDLIVPFLDKDEIAQIKQALPGQDVGYNNDAFWRDGRLQLTLTKGDVKLNLSDPIDFIKYKMLSCYPYTELVAPTWKERADKKTYKFAIIREAEDSDSLVQDMNVLQRAWAAWGKYEDEPKVLSYLYYKLRQKTIDKKTKAHIVKAWFKEVLEKDALLFVKYSKDDELLETKVIIFHALNEGVVTSEKNVLYFEGTRLSDDPKGEGFDGAAAFIAKPANQELKFRIEAKIK